MSLIFDWQLYATYILDKTELSLFDQNRANFKKNKFKVNLNLKWLIHLISNEFVKKIIKREKEIAKDEEKNRRKKN